MKKSLLIALSVIGAAGLASVQAQLIDVNFVGNSVGTDYAGGGPASPGPSMTGSAVLGSASDQWNNFGDSSFTFTPYPSGVGAVTASGLALNYANGSASGVTMSLIGDGTYNANEPNWGGSSPFTTAGSQYQNLMQDYMYVNEAQTITLSGLAANTAYDLILYNAADNNSGARATAFTVNGNSLTSTWDAATSTLVSGVTYVQYVSAMTDGSGNLVITYAPGTVAGVLSSEGDLDGFQLIQAVPEPASLAILAVAGMMLFVWRRRVACA